MGLESESSFSMGLGQILGQVEVKFRSQGRVPGLSSGFSTRFEDFRVKVGFQDWVRIGFRCRCRVLG